LAEVPRRVRDGRRNHDHVATILNTSPNLHVPGPLGPEDRAPDSIQFNLHGMDDANVTTFVSHASDAGISVQVFGLSADNARAFWNWEFLGDQPNLPQTRAMLMRACDVRLPARLSLEDCDYIADALVAAADKTMASKNAKAVA
jgi:hypothetical protein